MFKTKTEKRKIETNKSTITSQKLKREIGI